MIKREAAMRIVKLTEKEKNNILENLLKRSPNQYSKFEDTVNDIIENVRANKDKALFEYTEKFDGVKITEETFKVTDEEIEEAYTKVDERLIEIIRKALVNIRDYHQKQVRYSWFDSKTEDNTARKSRRLCAGRKSGISVISAYEHRTGKSCRC